MACSSQHDEPVVCRLCTSTEPGQLQIFGEDGQKNELSQKIKGCLFIKVHVKDSLTKFVCKTCVAKVEDFHKFQQSTSRVQSILERDSLKNQQKSESSESAVAEADKIVERLQGGGSALSITPVCIDDSKNSEDCQDILSSPSALSIIPIWRNSDSSGDDDSQWDSSPPYAPLPHLKNPCSEDYILMQEETFKLDRPIWSSGKSDVIEFNAKHENRSVLKDADITGTQSIRRVVLPPMWDVYERGADKENVTHRRYVISKSSFPCSLCGSCVAFHQQQTHQTRKHESFNQENFQQTVHSCKQETQENLHEQDNQLEHQILQDLRIPQFPIQEAGMLDCPECGKLFPRRSSWKRHLRTHYEGRAFICPLCGKGFNRKEHLSRHMMSHAGGRPFRCDTCFKPFTRKEHLARHLACNVGCGGTSSGFLSGMEQDMPRPFTCDVCLQTFMRKEHMIRHRKRAHLLMDGYTTPQRLLDEDGGHLYSCKLCNKLFPNEIQLHGHIEEHHQTVEMASNSNDENQDGSPSCNSNEKEDVGVGSPEQIEVEVNLLEDCSDDESLMESEHVLPKTITNSDGNSSTPTKGVDADAEDMELDQEDILRMQMNEAMRKVREGSNSPSIQAPRCEVCQKSFTRKSHLVRHLRRFHPHVELAYAAAYSLGNVPEEDTAHEETPLQTSLSTSTINRDDGGEADDESGSTLPSFSSDAPTSLVPRSKGGQHPCSICGKTFGRRYHLVRHRRTQHGVESVKAGPVGRPPKRLSFPSLPQSSLVQPFHCAVCSGHFSNHSDHQNHSCISNNNIISKRSGSRALAEMAAKISDKLNRSQGSFDYNCQSCGKKFCNKLELDKHVETHVNDLMEGMLWM